MAADVQRGRDPQIFTSDDPAVLAIVATFHADVDEWYAKMAAAKEALGRGLWTSRISGVPRTVIGIEHVDGEDPPDGWWKYASWEYLKPARGKGGNPARALLLSLKPPEDLIDRLAKATGLETMLLADVPHWYGWGYRFFDGDPRPYLRTSGAADTSKVPDVYRRVPLSLYYAMVEASDDNDAIDGAPV